MYKIQTITAGSAVASLDFTVPSGYDDLYIVVSTRSTSGTSPNVPSIEIQFNGSTSSYSTRYLTGDGSSPITGAPTYGYAGSHPGSFMTASTFSNTEIYIPNYASANNKSYSVNATAENNATNTVLTIVAGLWSNSAAITSIKLKDRDGNNLAQGSTATLYGIRKYNTTATPKATGGIITYKDGYWYHTFTASGTFTPTQSLTGVECLVVAGGGGGAIGGGGAGGVIGFTGQSLSATAYTVTVGGGGTAGNGTSPGTAGGNGNNSQFSTLTVAVGGGGAARENATNFPDAGNSGGSGGSGNPGGSSTQTSTGGTGYGNAGATSNTYTTPNYARGGGGGAGAVGNPATSGSTPGGGGNGTSAFSSWLLATGTGQNVSGTYYIAGGGGGSTYNGTGTSSGGYGGGGGGVVATATGISGSANTGGGGGGTGDARTSGAGGSGLVIVRYAA